MILTNEGKLQARLTQPAQKTAKIYYVQVEGEPDEAALAAFRAGLPLKDGLTLPAGVTRVDEPEWLWPRTPPIRRMTAHIGHPTLRLIRYQIAEWCLADLAPGEWRDIGLA